jgi:hypothetical protein
MKKLVLFFLLLRSCTPAMGQYNHQQGYASLNLAWVPGGNNMGWLGCQLTIGRQIGKAFAEYNQNITLTPDANAPKLFQFRGGVRLPLDRELTLRPFVGYSITSVPQNKCNKVGHGITAGAYLVQEIKRSDVSIRYELSVSNHFLIVPSIGMFVKF